MNIRITTRGYKAPERLKKYLEDKANRLHRFENVIRDFEAILSYEKIDQIVEFKLNINKKTIIVKEKSDDIFKSIDLAIDNLERQVVKAKEITKNRRKQKPAEMLEV